MGSPWKAISDGNRRKILMLLKKREMNPTAIAKHFDFTLPGLSAHLRILKDANLIVERKQGQHVLYSLNKKGSIDKKRLLKSNNADVIIKNVNDLPNILNNTKN